MKRIILILAILVGVYTSQAFGTTPIQTKIKKTIYTQSSGAEGIQQVIYLDGMGRAKQSIGIGASPTGKDVVGFTLFDCMGRADSVSYLPYTISSSSPGAMRPNPKSEQQSFYNSLFPGDADVNYAYAVKQYDKGLGRVQLAKGVGQNAHTNSVYYGAGTDCSYIKKLRMTPDLGVIADSYYQYNELSFTATSNAYSQAGLNTESYEYKNAEGQIVAKEFRVSDTDRRITYYVYDEMGRQRYIIPPIQGCHLFNNSYDEIYVLCVLNSNQPEDYDVIANARYGVLAVDHPSVYFHIVDIMSAPEIEQQYGEYGTPTVLIYANGELLFEINGYHEPEYYTSLISPLTTNAMQPQFSLDYLRKYCFYSEYDKYGNVIKQYVPGAEPVYNVYDKRNRLVMSQNGNQRTTNTWSYTKYDIYDRPVYSGTVTGGTLTSHASAAQSQTVYGERVGGSIHGYTNQTYPTSGITADNVLSVSYYDNYQWLAGTTHSFSSANALGTTPVYTNITGLATGSLTKVLDPTASSPQWLKSVVYYDDECRTIQTVADLYPSGIEITANKHNFTGQVIQTRVVQTVGSQSYSYDKWFNFDKYGRLQNVQQQITGDASNGKVTIASYEYDELGNVRTEKIHNSLETTTKEYRVDGSLTASTSPSFSYRLGFDREAGTGLNTLPNGNLSHVVWGAGTTLDKGYQFSYAKTGEMTAANYRQKSGATWQSADKFNEQMAYDRNGNVLSVKRTDADAATLHDLTVEYNGNLLTKLNYASGTSSADFLYDANGNMTRDGQTGVQIEYNILDLPQKIFAGTNSIRYIYSASGEKLASVVGSSLTYYRSVMTYAKNGSSAEQLLQIGTQGGFVALEGSAWVYKYLKTDHLGSTRKLLAARSGSLQTEQTTDYYPFGLAHGALSNLHLNKYLYSGKEIQDASIAGSLLGLYDFHARYYNPVLGRWFNIDPALQLANPYLYCNNSPMMFTDPDGRFPWLSMAAMIYIGGAQANAIHCGMNGTNPFNPGNWNWGSGSTYIGMASGAGFSPASSIGSLFGHGLGSVGMELARAGAHGLAGGLMNAAQGGNFWAGFGVGAVSSLAGSGMGALGMSDGLSGAMGGVGALTAWGLGGDPMSGFMQGFNVGYLNHTAGARPIIVDGKVVYEMDPVVVYGSRPSGYSPDFLNHVVNNLGGVGAGMQQLKGTFRVTTAKNYGMFVPKYYANAWWGNPSTNVYSMAKLGSKVNFKMGALGTGMSYYQIATGDTAPINYADAGVGTVGLGVSAASYFGGTQIPYVGPYIALYGVGRLFYDLGATYHPISNLINKLSK